MSSWKDLLEIINKRIKDLEHDKRSRFSHVHEHEYRDLSIHRRRIHRITSRHEHIRPETYLRHLIESEAFHDVSDTVRRNLRNRIDANEYYRILTRLTSSIEHEKTVMEIEYARNHDPTRRVFIEALKELKVHIITKAPVNRFENITRLRRIHDFGVILRLVQDFHTIRIS